MIPPAGPSAANPADKNKEARSENLRSDRHISLAVNFPLEGRVYHFKKINADAHLTLWSLQPSRFVRVGWLAALLAGLFLFWVIRRVARWSRFRTIPNRVTVGPPVSSAPIG